MESHSKKRYQRSSNGKVKFNLTLNEEQKEAKDRILRNAMTVLTGKAGSGKTLLACQIALDQLFNREVDRIVITRPTVSKEEIGFLPGDIAEKMAPWISPIYANFNLLYQKDKIEQLIADGKIEIVPVAFMRGRTFVDSFVIVDEAQNVTDEQMEMCLTRLGKNSKMIICGDIAQTDLKKGNSGFKFLTEVEERIQGFEIISLSSNHRHTIVDDILEIYKEKNKD